MSTWAQRGIQALFAAGLMLTIAGCDEPAAPVSVRTPEAVQGIFGTYVLDPAQSDEYDLSDRCGAPLSSTLVLEGGTWRREWNWAPGCIESEDPEQPVTYSVAGRFELRGDTITLRPNGAELDEMDVEAGSFDSERVTIYGHCGGADVYVRKPLDGVNPAAGET